MTARRALIIETENSAVEELSGILTDGGYQVSVAGDSDTAVELAQEELPDIVLLAIQSPDLNGLQILQRLKKRGTTKNLPIILLLERFDEEYVAHGLEMGAADYVRRPYSPEEILSRVGVLTRMRLDKQQWRDLLSKYREKFDGEQQGLFLSTLEGRFLDVNETVVNMLGYENKEELLKIDLKKDLYWDPEDRKRLHRKAIEDRGVVRNVKVNFRSKDGRKITILLNSQVVLDEEGAIIGYEGSYMDISGEKDTAGVRHQDPEDRSFVGKFLQQFVPRIFPFGGEYFSLIKMTELIAERYEKIVRLGIGTFGEVWKVRDVEQEGPVRYYVVKIANNKKYNAQFRNEAEICRRLEDHPNAVRIVDVVKDHGRVMLVQEFVSGPTLKKLMERSLEEGEKESIVLQLVDIVAYAHQHDIMHRDIKPENIIVQRDGTVKLLDYGVAKELKKKDFSSTVVGSRPFMAPEQIMGKSQIASDVWALGVIMYGIYTEYLPFFHETEKILMDQILKNTPEPPREIEPSITVDLEGIILMCLEKDPTERYADAGVLEEALLEKIPGFGSR